MFNKINIQSLIKSVGGGFRDDHENLAEKLIDYFALIDEYDREKMFITINFRSFVPDELMELFLNDIIARGYLLIMLENREYPLLSGEKRYIVDKDLCEITG